MEETVEVGEEFRFEVFAMTCHQQTTHNKNVFYDLDFLCAPRTDLPIFQLHTAASTL